MSHPPLSEPSDWIRRWAHLLPATGPVLDLACGAGRHARWLCEQGFTVTAVDRDLSGLADFGEREGLERIEADLEGEGWPLEGRGFAGIVVTNYLWRPRFDDLLGMLLPGGALLYETFARGNERFGKPSNPDFLLKTGELLQLVAGQLTVVAFEDGVVESPKPAVVQRIAAIRGALAPLEPRA